MLGERPLSDKLPKEEGGKEKKLKKELKKIRRSSRGRAWKAREDISYLESKFKFKLFQA